MADPTKPSSKPPEAKKPKADRKKITFFEAIRRVEIAMRDLSPEACLKLVDYAQTHARERRGPTALPEKIEVTHGV